MKPSRILLMQKRLLTPIFLGSRIALWFDVADSRTIILNGFTASEWRDKSGNARHALQGVAANQPTYTVNNLNGRPALNFDGINDVLTSSYNYASSDYLVTCIFSQQTWTSGDRIFCTDNRFDGPVQFTSAPNLVIGGSNTPVSPAVPLGTAMILSFSRTGATQTMRVNGNSNAVTWTGATGTIRLHIGGFDTSFSNISMGEFIITPVLSTNDRQKLEGYFAHKWRLTASLPNDHPFKFRPPYM